MHKFPLNTLIAAGSDDFIEFIGETIWDCFIVMLLNNVYYL